MVNKKVWIISEYYYPVTTGTGYYMTEIAEYLADKGINVHVICVNSKYNDYSFTSDQKSSIRNGVHIHRITSLNLDKNNFIKRLCRLLISSWLIFFKTIISVRKGDKILVATNPAFLILIMPFIAWLKNVNYRILVHDIFPENLVAIKKISANSLMYKLMKFLFDRAYSSANECIVIGRDMKEILLAKTGNKTSIRIIPIWADVNSVFPLDKCDTDMCQKMKLSNKFIFQFAGNLGYAQGVDNLLDAIRTVKNEHIHFLFIGSGAKYDVIQDYIVSFKARNISLLPFQDKSMQNDFINACDVGIVTLSEGMYGLGVPSKSYNIMAAGKPILYIGDNESEIALCINEYSLGWIVKPGDPNELSLKFEKIYEKKSELSTMGKNARNVAKMKFAKFTILEQFFDTLCK